LLQQIQVDHDITPVDIDETCAQHEPVIDCAIRLALTKARVGLSRAPDAVVIGSDTLVTVDGLSLGKPQNRENALQMLESLSGRQHEVITAVAVVRKGRELSGVSRTMVTFRALSAREIAAYWETGEPRDKAGAYAIQGIAARFVTNIEGSYSGVMGLPLYETAQLLEEIGVQLSVPADA
jgi:septum formation protein